MAHKSGIQFFGMDVRRIWINLQDDAKERYNFDGREIPNFGTEFLRIELCACQGFGCESADDTINTAIVGWCGGTSSWPACQVESG